MIELRDYQQTTVDDIYKSWNTYHKNVLAVLPTGAGKSVIMSYVVKQFANRHQHCAVIAHRNELVSQMSCHLARAGVMHRIVASTETVAQINRKHYKLFGRSFVNPRELTAVVGVDTLISRYDSMVEWGRQIDLWVQDEAHHQLTTNKWGRALALFPHARGLGVTATPARADGQGLGRFADGFMDDMIIGPTTRYLIEHGYLADYEIVCPKSDLNVDGVEVSKNGDWSNQALRKAAKKSKIVGDVVSNYMMYALGRKTIVFATDVETADEIASDFNTVGVKAVSLNGNSATAYREKSIEEFAEGDVQVLVNVDLFDEGFDVPACDVIIMARPTASLGKYLQMIGRGLRPQEGKTALIIDHVSNVLRHGLPDQARVWSLDRRAKRAKVMKDPDELDLTVCKHCLKPYEKFRTVCPYCGFEKPLPDPHARSIEMVDGDLVLLDKATLERLRTQTVIESPADIGKRVTFVAGPIAGKAVAKKQAEKIAAQTALKEVIATWAGIERSKGFTDQELYRKFYLATGVDVLTAMSAERSKQDYELMTMRVKGWYMK